MKICDQCGFENRDTAKICANPSCRKDISDVPTTDGLGGPTKYDDLVGQVIGNRYEIEELLGKGGMGEVYKVKDLAIPEIIAVKLLPEKLSDHKKAVKNLKAEVKNTRNLAHDNIVRIYHFEEIDEFKFVTMEFVNGKSFAQLLYNKGKIPFEELIEYTKRTRRDGQLLIQVPHIRSMLANMQMELLASRLLIYNIIWKLDKGEPVNQDANLAKVYITEANDRFFNSAMEIIGQYGELEILNTYTKWLHF